MKRSGVSVIACVVCCAFVFAAGRNDDAYRDAKTAFDAKRYFAAIPLLEKVIDENPYYLDAGLLYADCCIVFENYVRAKEVLDKLAKYHPRAAGVIERMLRIDLAETRYDDAAKTLKRLLSLDNKNPYAAYAEGFLEEAKGHMESALERYKRAVELNEDGIDENTAAGYIYLFLGKKDPAKLYFEKIIKPHQRDESVYYHLANYHYLAGNLSDALSAVNKALYYYKDYTRAKLLLADIYVKGGNYRRAVETIRAVNDKHLKGEKNYRLGYLHEKLNDSKAALASYQAYLAENPDELFARIAYERVLFASVDASDERREEASRFYRAAAKRYLRENDFLRAEIYYKRLLRLFPTDADARRDLANIYRNAGFVEKYMIQMNIAGDLSPDNTAINAILEYKKRDLDQLPSRSYGIKQYDIAASGFSVAVLDNLAIVRGDHEGLERSMAEILAHALHQFPKLSVAELYERRYTDEGTLAALAGANASFFLTGSIIERGDTIGLDIRMIDARTRRNFRTYRSFKSGKEKMIEAAYEIARNIAKDLPMFGKVIKIQENDIILDIGKEQGVSKGMRFDVFAVRYPSFDLDTRSIIAAREDIVGRIRVRTVDERVSICEVEDPSQFKFIRHNNYVIPVQEKAESRPKK
ncbi:MAG: tetratricopeptide repeat protein [Spirochaetota bacterium]